MRKSELKILMNQLRTASGAANWQGKFTYEIREATREIRLYEIANPLQEAIKIVQKELDRKAKKRKNYIPPTELRLPYKD